MRAHALLGSAQKMNSKEPLIERDVGIGKDRSHCDGELLPAPAALPYALTDCLLGTRLWFEAVSVVKFAAMRANWAFGPTLILKKFAGFIRVAEVLCDVRQIHLFVFH